MKIFTSSLTSFNYTSCNNSFRMFIKITLVAVILLFTLNLVRCEPNIAWDCETSSTKVMYFDDSVLTPTPVIYPGNISIDSYFNLTEDIPSENFFCQMEVIKLEPKRMRIPCLAGRGSCIWDVCNGAIPEFKDELCAFGVCECPLKKGPYHGNGVIYNLPNMGKIIEKIVPGNYSASVKFYNKGTSKVYGKLCMNFTVVMNK